jgi:hypothetical protein
MTKANEIFTPNSFPTYTYVERHSDGLEALLRNALSIKNTAISISGPTKTGKTALLKKVVSPDLLIPVAGASIKSADDLWRLVLAWMEVPYSVTHSTSVGGSLAAEIKASAEAGIIIAKGRTEGAISGNLDIGKEKVTAVAFDGLITVSKEIGNSEFIVFVDDFHYIPTTLQPEIARQIKAAIEIGVKVCVATVPHRSDDVFRANSELRGRITSIDSKYWPESDLIKIAQIGFKELNIIIDSGPLKRLAGECFGSPQLMQSVCLNLCFAMGIEETCAGEGRKVSGEDIKRALTFTASNATHQSTVEGLHSGPRQRGMERKEFSFKDGTKGDVYRAILLAVATDPIKLNLQYSELLRRVQELCLSESPVGSSISGALEQMDKIASNYPPKPIEWQDDVLDIVDPYFLFFLRSSEMLRKIGSPIDVRGGH